MKSLIALAALTILASQADACGRRHRCHIHTTTVCQPCQTKPAVTPTPPPAPPPTTVSLTQPQTQVTLGGCANGTCNNIQRRR